MSTTRTLQLSQNIPYTIAGRKEGFWDTTINITPTTNSSHSITMDVYNGLSSEYKQNYDSSDAIDFSSTVLPWKVQYSNLLETSKFCLMPVNGGGVATYNFRVVGEPAINPTTKIAKDFSANFYIEMLNYPSSISNFEIVFKVKTPTTFSEDHMVILGQSSANYKTPQIEINNVGKMLAMVTTGGASPWITIRTENSISTDTWYWVKCTWDGSTISLYISTDGTAYTLCESKACSAVYWDQVCRIGRDNDNASIYTGSIDLSESYIKINGENYWVPEITYDTSLYENIVNSTSKSLNSTLTVVGSPTISSDFIVSNFSNTACLSSGARNMPISNNTTFYTKIHTATIGSSWQMLVKRTSSFAIVITDGKICAYNYTTGETEEIFSVNENTDYYFRIEFLPTSKRFGLSTDGINWNTYNMLDSTRINTNVTYFGRDNNEKQPFLGTMDFKETYMINESNGHKYWTGCAPNSIETLQGCTYNFTDTGAATTLNVFVVNKTENIVLTPNNSYPNGWKLGTVNIPAHTVYDYDNGYWTES